MNKFQLWLQKEKKIIIREFTSDPPKKVIRNLLFVLLGAIVMAVGDSFFIIPMNVIFGGVSSLSLISNSLPGMNALSVQTYVYIYTWGFFLLGLILIGLKYSLKTLTFAIVYPLCVSFFSWLISVCVIDGHQVLNLSQVFSDIVFADGVSKISAQSDAMQALSYILSAVLGGVISGTGIGLAFVGGGSSGGTDVINILVNRYTGIKVGTSSFIVDTLIIIGGFFANGNNIIASLVGVISSFICAFMIDKVFLGWNQYYLAQIISDKWSEINDFINKDLGRGTTLVKGNGGYTKKDATIVEACFDKQDFLLIKQSIYQIDPSAFVMVIPTQEILGYGFSRDRPKPDINDITPDEARRLVAKAKRKRKRTFYFDEGE